MLHLDNAQLERQLFGRHKILKLPVQLLIFFSQLATGWQSF